MENIDPMKNEINYPKASKFAVVFEDGVIYIYYKGDEEYTKEDYKTSKINILNSSSTNSSSKDDRSSITKSDVILKM